MLVWSSAPVLLIVKHQSTFDSDGNFILMQHTYSAPSPEREVSSVALKTSATPPLSSDISSAERVIPK